MKTAGKPYVEIQPEWEVEEDENGLLTGTMDFEGAAIYAGMIPQTGSLHPRDPRLTCFKRSIKRLRADKVRGTLSYIGLVADPTPMFIEHPGGSGQDPIETHPNFKKFAGSPVDPKNGAQFDVDTGEFLGFFDQENDCAGVKSYIVPSIMVSLSFYTHYVPDLAESGTIYNYEPPDLLRPPNVKNFLLLGMPYRKIGNLFQVTHQILGSGPRGWNKKIYKS